MKIYPLILASALVLSACSSGEPFSLDGTDLPDDLELVDSNEPKSFEDVNNVSEKTFLDLFLDFDDTELSINDKFNDFGLRYFAEANKIAEKDQNFLCSPVSATVATMMMANGASDDFRNQVSKAFNVGDIDALTLHTAKINKSINYSQNGLFISSSNSVWVDNGLNPTTEYTSLLKNVFNAPVTTLDFNDSNCGNIVNQWVRENTRGMIDGVVPNGALHGQIMWANALFLEGEWQYKFDKELTDRQIFHGTRGDSEVDMMHQEIAQASCDYIDGYILVELFAGRFGSFVAVLPPENVNIDDAVNEFTEQIWAKADFRQLTANLSFPKLKMSTEYQATDALRNLGINLDEVRMPGLGLMQSGQSALGQKASLELDEDGATAAVVSHNNWGTGNGWLEDVSYIDVAFDRPFLFLIRANYTNTILFAGKVTNL